jgi:hypothetical protein
MSSIEYATLSLEIFPSRLLLSTSHAAHIFGLSAIALISVPDIATASLVAGLVSSWVWLQVRYGAAGGRWFIRGIEWFGSGQWFLHSGTGAIATADLTGGFIHPRILILNFRTANGFKRSVVILPDAGDPEAIRRLRRRLLALDHFSPLGGQRGSDSRPA